MLRGFRRVTGPAKADFKYCFCCRIEQKVTTCLRCLGKDESLRIALLDQQKIEGATNGICGGLLVRWVKDVIVMFNGTYSEKNA